ncbi:MAG TPA: type VI secretion system lipoprotein TssJ [Desulfomonilia bacterium]|nr:type VI secretion system lipoprotein TssJ [Desulfomonilia bacterium]
MSRAALIWFFLAPFIFSCASAPVEPVKYGYEKDAIELDLKVDKQLNYKDKKAHTLVLCVYQLISPNAFNQLSGSRDGLYSLLECGVFDPGSVAVSRQIVVNPGKELKVKLDRAEGARYVALVAGYYAIDKDKIVRLYQVPEISERYGFLWLHKRTRPDRLEVNLVLGPRQLQDPKPEQESHPGKDSKPAQETQPAAHPKKG